MEKLAPLLFEGKSVITEGVLKCHRRQITHAEKGCLRCQPAEEVRRISAEGKEAKARGSSQLESEHARMPKWLPGTRCAVPLWHAATCVGCLAQQQSAGVKWANEWAHQGTPLSLRLVDDANADAASHGLASPFPLRQPAPLSTFRGWGALGGFSGTAPASATLLAVQTAVDNERIAQLRGLATMGDESAALAAFIEADLLEEAAGGHGDDGEDVDDDQQEELEGEAGSGGGGGAGADLAVTTAASGTAGGGGGDTDQQEQLEGVAGSGGGTGGGGIGDLSNPPPCIIVNTRLANSRFAGGRCDVHALLTSAALVLTEPKMHLVCITAVCFPFFIYF